MSSAGKIAGAVWPAIRADFDLRCFYERLARRKGANKAKVSTARRLLTVIYKVWKEQRNYIPLDGKYAGIDYSGQMDRLY